MKHFLAIFLFAVPLFAQQQKITDTIVVTASELPETVEIMLRTWHVEGNAVRPDHRMVAHTGFLTSARLLGPVPGGLKATRSF